NETSNWKIGVPENHISIDAYLQAMNRNYAAAIGLAGDAKLILRKVNEELAKEPFTTPSEEYLEEVLSVRKELRLQLRATLGPYEN
ncbi:hypothetical protein QM259_19630, partial [Acinetobacter baumannii]|uniref:hypothetical protein n=1 Tax=Acinetobacter baumannii TaxID=470 RepID=UPI0024B732BD